MHGDLTALIGVSDDSQREQIHDILFNRFGYFTTAVSKLDKMLTLMKRDTYHLYLMELDSRAAGSHQTYFAKNFYQGLEEKIKRKDAKFLCLCNDEDVLSYAQQEGLPACLISDFVSDPDRFIGD